jgi:L-alanine-DL-glutamate epimerase-like enolase superfamily enzyme
MKVIQSECLVKTLRLSESYSIAYESVDRCDNVFLCISTREGFTGRGCAAPAENVTGESSRDVLECYRKTIEPVLKGEDVFRYAWILDTLRKEIPDKPSALAMVDMALHDILAQKAGLPLCRLLGSYRSSMPTSITIGIMPLENAIEKARNYIKHGFTILKIKGGINVQEDIDKINRIREAVGKQVKIRFDANQGYTVEDSLEFIKGTLKASVELFEQPTPARELQLLAEITRKAAIPVMADESLLSLKDVFRISKDRCTDLINIKLMKTGGIQEAMHINSVAKAAGIRVMVGCMDESALSISAGLHFALSRPNIKYADLDGHMDILNDPFDGLIKIENGVLFPPVYAGLGWTGLKNIGL